MAVSATQTRLGNREQDQNLDKLTFIPFYWGIHDYAFESNGSLLPVLCEQPAT